MLCEGPGTMNGRRGYRNAGCRSFATCRGQSEWLGGALQECIAHRPFMPVAAGRAECADRLLANAQQGADLALDPTVDVASSCWANENEVFHGELRAWNIAQHRVDAMTPAITLVYKGHSYHGELCGCGPIAASSSFSTSKFPSCRHPWPAPWIGSWPPPSLRPGGSAHCRARCSVPIKFAS